MTPHPEPSTRTAERIIRRVVSAGAHISYDHLEACVDQRADAALRERVDTHVRWCAACAAELRDLTLQAPALRERLQPVAPTGTGWLSWLKSGTHWLPQVAMASVVAAVALTVVLQDPRQASEDHTIRTLPGAVGGGAPAFDTSVLDRLSKVSPEAAEAQRRGDDATLARLLTASADQGNVTAASALGTLYMLGRGVAADPALAERYWRQAAEAGSVEAQRNLEALRSQKVPPR